MIGYLDTPSGISGDMFLGCLVDAGWPLEALRETVHALRWPEGFSHDAWSVEQRTVMKGPLRATLVDVRATEEGQPHRHLSDMRALLENSTLPSTVIQDALDIFTRLAEAEGAVHGTDLEEVHFHEVGALDSIIDIVGVCAGLHALGLTELYAGPLPVGQGFVQSQHGMLPLPAPAPREQRARANAPIKTAPGPGELVTPTGAALVLHFVGGHWQQPPMRLQKVAIGAGQKNFDWPNVARLWVGEPWQSHQPHSTHHEAGVQAWHSPNHAHSSHAPRMSVLETNIDDMNPEFYAAVSEKLFAGGARDVWFTPIQMKKNRPGVMLSVLTTVEDEARLARLVLSETTTLGMRVRSVGRYEAERRLESVETPYGIIPVKLKIVDDEVIGAVPEFEACRTAAAQHGIATRAVYEAAAALAWQRFLAPATEPSSSAP